MELLALAETHFLFPVHYQACRHLTLWSMAATCHNSFYCCHSAPKVACVLAFARSFGTSNPCSLYNLVSSFFLSSSGTLHLHEIASAVFLKLQCFPQYITCIELQHAFVTKQYDKHIMNCIPMCKSNIISLNHIQVTNSSIQMNMLQLSTDWHWRLSTLPSASNAGQ